MKSVNCTCTIEKLKLLYREISKKKKTKRADGTDPGMSYQIVHLHVIFQIHCKRASGTHPKNLTLPGCTRLREIPIPQKLTENCHTCSGEKVKEEVIDQSHSAF